jgi:hypothetical protein
VLATAVITVCSVKSRLKQGHTLQVLCILHAKHTRRMTSITLATSHKEDDHYFVKVFGISSIWVVLSSNPVILLSWFSSVSLLTDVVIQVVYAHLIFLSWSELPGT